MLTLHIVRGPLDENLNLAILNGYTSLAHATVTPENFRRWMQHSPEGPALHAILKNQDGVVAGHCCLFPFPMNVDGKRVTVAKAEYFFDKTEFRKEPAQGYEGSMKPAAVLLLERLYRSGRELGWCPYLVSAPTEVAPLHRLAGCRKIVIPLTECLLTFRPWKAAVSTPNLVTSQRMALAAVGTLQRLVWTFPPKADPQVRAVPVDARSESSETLQRISLSCDPDFLAWRYSSSEYLRLRMETSADLGVIVKRGSPDQYVRVCHTSLGSDEQSWKPLLKALIANALAENALGVRWAVYDDSVSGNAFVTLLRKMAFMCVRRERTIHALGLGPAELQPAAWHLQDSLFCFDS
jgi:hypothetical protein